MTEIASVLPRKTSSSFGLFPPGQSKTTDSGSLLPRLIELSLASKPVFRWPDSDDVYPEWRRLVVTHAVSGKKAHDARLVAAMTVNGITHILTFNVDDFTRYAGINVLHPAQL